MDRNAFDKLALEHLDSVYRMAMQLARHPDEASDLVQETYLKALRVAERFEEKGGGIRPWLFKILHNVFYSKVGRPAGTGGGPARGDRRRPGAGRAGARLGSGEPGLGARG